MAAVLLVAMAQTGALAQEASLQDPAAFREVGVAPFRLSLRLLTPHLRSAAATVEDGATADTALDLGLAVPRLGTATFRLGGFRHGDNTWGAEAGLTLRGASAALSLRGAFLRLDDGSETAVTGRGIELALSRRFTGFTSYVGWGRMWLDDGAAETDRDPAAERYFLGARLDFGSFDLDLEGDVATEDPGYRVRLGWRF